MSVSISKIRRDGGTQSRAALNEQTVAEYAEAMSDPDTVFPPVTVYFDGKDYWLADGFHRVAAWERLGRTDIPAEIKQGDRRRAILHSVAANNAHGLRRTNDDKRRAVMTLLEDAEWSQWSDREIARRCAVDHKTVTRIRAEHLGNSPDSGVRTVERNGTTYQQNTAKIGAKSVKKARQSPLIEPNINSDPSASDREEAIDYLLQLLLHATNDWDQVAAALYQVSTSEIREQVLEAIAENEDG